MFNAEQLNAPSKIWAATALTFSLLSIALLVIARVINAARSAGNYSPQAQMTQQATMIIMLIFAVVSLIGLVISIIALFKTIKKPQIHSGKGIAITALILNGIFSLISVASILFILILAVQYLSGK